MSLVCWLPLNGDLHNQGCTDYTITAIEASPTFTAGKIGQCYQRANTSSQITNGLQIQDNLVSTFGTTASVAVWVKPLGTHTHYNGTILSSGDWNRKRWAFGVSQDNSQVDILCGGYNNYISCAVPVNQWTHLASTFENGVCKLYKNGVYVGEKSGQAAFDSDANWTGICRETYAGGYFGFNGCINDLRIYDHVLSAAEVKEISQGLVLHYKLDDLTNGIKDSGGYGHNGTITGTITAENESPRYSSSIYVNGSSYILTPATSFGWYQLDKGTLTCWMKPTASMTGWRGSVGIAADADNNSRGWSLTDYGNVFQVTYGNGSYSLVSSGKTLTQNEWHHCAATIDGTTFKLYFDGELVKTQTITWNSATLNTNARFQVGVDLPGSDEKFIGNYSDVRFYTTVLSDNDILQLYHTGAKIDNKANFHTYEINENGTNKLTKTGIMYDNMEESIMTLPDGSHWQLLMFHYVDDGKNLFTSANANNCNDFGLFSRLKDIDGFKLNSQYEFYAIQDGTAYRWIQTNAPLTTTAVAGFSAVSGYNSPGAGICKCNGNTLLARTNTTSNWWNAFGCYTLYSGGIPGLNSAVCKKYLALYARIKNADVKLSNQTANVSEFIEL